MRAESLYRTYLKELKEVYSTEEAAAITDIIFDHFLKISRSDILINGSRVLNEKETAMLSDALTRLLHHHPVQYVTGTAWFGGYEFSVDPSVLIPRPETEELVMLAREFSLNNKKEALDIGTGSGCIAILLKRSNPALSVTAVDISTGALTVAGSNAEKLQAPVTFLELDINNENEWKKLGSYDIIISNPPYIPFNELHEMEKHVTDHEPHLALFVPDNDPLLFYRSILTFSQSHLDPEGMVFLETHKDLAQAVAALFTDAGYISAIKKDMFGKERMVTATRQG